MEPKYVVPLRKILPKLATFSKTSTALSNLLSKLILGFPTSSKSPHDWTISAFGLFYYSFILFEKRTGFPLSLRLSFLPGRWILPWKGNEGIEKFHDILVFNFVFGNGWGTPQDEGGEHQLAYRFRFNLNSFLLSLIEKKIIIKEPTWESTWPVPWMSCLSRWFMDSNGKHETAHSGPNFLVKVTKCLMWWILIDCQRRPGEKHNGFMIFISFFSFLCESFSKSYHSAWKNPCRISWDNQQREKGLQGRWIHSTKWRYPRQTSTKGETSRLTGKASW